MKRLALALILLGLPACGPEATTDAGADASLALDAGPGADSGPEVDAGPGADSGADSGPDASVAFGEHRALFVGNSYTFVNDLPSLHRTIVEALPSAPGTLVIDSSTGGGRRLVQHATDATTVGHPLHTALSTDVSWTHVVLQEQSQIPGFPDGQAQREASMVAAADLAALADMRGATVVLFMTWGRREGDADNATLFPDFTTMQNRLEAGYRALAVEAEGAGADVMIAPVGLAFREVHDVATDPLATDSLFWSLYAADGSHPSVAGSYLAACVIIATVLGVDATTITHVPTGLDAGDASSLRDAAQTAVAAERARP